MSIKYFRELALASLMACAALSLASCDDNDVKETPEPPGPATNPTVALHAGKAAQDALTFTVDASEGALQIAYTCVVKGRAVPGAEKLFAESTVAEPDGQPRRIDGLAAETDYVIAAAARTEELYSEVATLEMRTADAPEPEYEIVEATASLGSSYYAGLITGEEGTGLYHLFLSTIPWDAQGTAQGAGILYRLSLHAPLSANPEAPVLADGTYALDDTYAAGTFDPEHSDWFTTNASGAIETSGTVHDGLITVESTGSGYKITARIVDSQGGRREVRWDGSIEWQNMVPGGTAHYANAFYLGKNADHPDSDYWLIQFADNGTEPRWVATLDLYAEVSEDYATPTIAEGTYRVAASETFAAGSLTPGIPGPSQMLDMGSFVDSDYGRWYISEGTVDVSRNGSEYTFVCNLKDTQGRLTRVTYTGTLPIDNRYTPPVDWDMDVALDRQPAGKYYGETSTEGIYEYFICLSDGEVGEWWNPSPVQAGQELHFLEVDLYSTVAPSHSQISLPEGTYRFSEDYADLVCDPYASDLNYWDENGLKRTVEFASGTVAISATDNGWCIVLDAVSTDGQSIRCTYEGSVRIDNASGIQLPEPQWRTTHRRPCELLRMHIGSTARGNALHPGTLLR